MYQQILHNSTLIPQLYLYRLLFMCLIISCVYQSETFGICFAIY